jgi:quinoprotein glucose dehydrogenase
VNSRNVKQLEVAWNYETGDELSYTFCPLVVDNIAHVAAKQGALSPVEHGQELGFPFPGRAFSGMRAARAKSGNKDRTDRRILVTSSGMLHAIDAHRQRKLSLRSRKSTKTGLDRASALGVARGAF